MQEGTKYYPPTHTVNLDPASLGEAHDRPRLLFVVLRKTLSACLAFVCARRVGLQVVGIDLERERGRCETRGSWREAVHGTLNSHSTRSRYLERHEVQGLKGGRLHNWHVICCHDGGACHV